MFEARLNQGIILKKIIEALKDLVTDVNIDCNADGISLQAMDTSHVALVTFFLRASDFDEFRCDRSQTLGMSLVNLSKIIKCADNDDAITIRADDDASHITFIFEGKKEDKVSEFNLNLLHLDSEHLGIPEQEYNAIATLSSSEFARVCRELSQISDTLSIEVTKQYIRFSVTGDIGGGSVTLKHNESERTVLEVVEPVSMSYALRYLNLFNKAASLGDEVKLCLHSEVPLVVHFGFPLGEVKYYLAPKISDE